MTRTTAAALAASLVAAVAVTGCTSSSTPRANYSTAASSSPASASESRTPGPNRTINVQPGAVQPTLYGGAPQHTAEGALAFVSYYWQMLNWAYSTNDASAIDGLFASSCTSCSSFRDSLARDTANGYTLVGGHLRVVKVDGGRPTDGVGSAEFAFDVTLDVEALSERNSGGAVATAYPAETAVQRTYLGWSDAKWRVVDTAKVTT